MTTLHTPGPLAVGFYQPSETFLCANEHVAVLDQEGGLVALTGYSHGEQDAEIVAQSIADAHLFAAAPDLLEACQDILYAWDNGDDAGRDLIAPLDNARRALAKAKQETKGESK